MPTYTNQTKNTSIWLNFKKNVRPQDAFRLGASRLGFGRLGSQTTPAYTNQSKNSSTWSNQSKN